MRLSIISKLSPSGIDLERILEAERLGYEAVWFAEAWGSDAVTPAAWALARTTRLKAGTAIMQMAARTPAAAAMTAMTLQALSANRFILGIGPSGPQVVEGWHGVPFGKPLLRSREYIAIIRNILERKAPLEWKGEHYRIPYDGPGASGQGKPLKSILHGDPSLKIYTAAMTRNGFSLAGEIADGTLPFFMSPEKADIVLEPLREGIARAAGKKSLADFDLAPFVRVRIGEDLEACRDGLRAELALYIGGMGARGKNFYNAFACRLGYEEAAGRIEDLYLSRRYAEAAAAVPAALIDEISLVGPKGRVKERLEAWKGLEREGRLGSLVLSGADTEALRFLAEEAF